MTTIIAKDWNKIIAICNDFGQDLAALDMEIEFRAEAEYSGYQEYGTYKMEAHPFFYDNFENGASQIEQVLQSPDPTPDKIQSVGQDILDNMKNDAPYDTGNLQSKIVMEKR